MFNEGASTGCYNADGVAFIVFNEGAPTGCHNAPAVTDGTGLLTCDLRAQSTALHAQLASVIDQMDTVPLVTCTLLYEAAYTNAHAATNEGGLLTCNIRAQSEAQYAQLTSVLDQVDAMSLAMCTLHSKAAYTNALAVTDQIGRASCRERV